MISPPMHGILLLAASWLAVLSAAAAPKAGGPSRPALAGCAWEKVSDAAIGLEAWVERCDFGSRKIDFRLSGGSLAVRYSDGGEPDPVVDVFDLLPGESAETGIRRLFAQRTEPKLAARCMLAPYAGGSPRAGVARYMFVPDEAYGKELGARPDSDEVPEPPCGSWGYAPDGIQYWEAQPGSGARKILFVRVGQDEPLFDEQTLRLLPAR
jgi:hypothetical protein